MTRVVWLVSWWPNAKEPTHGIFNKRWAETIKDLFELIVVVADPTLPSGLWQDESAVFYELHRMGYSPSYLGKLAAAKGSVELLRKLRNWSPEFLHIFSPAPFGRIKPWLILKGDTKIIVVDQTVSTQSELESLGLKIEKVYRNTFMAAHIVHVTNEEQILRLQKIGLLTKQHEVKVISNVVPEASQKSIKQVKKDRLGDEYTFLHISGLRDHQKNVSGIIRAFAKTVKEYSQARLLIGGDGPDRKMLEALTISLKLTGSVKFIGELDREQVRSQLSKADTLVMFSRREIDSVISLEAMSMDVPLLLSAFCSAAHKTQSGKFGTLVSIEDEDGLANGMGLHVKRNWREAQGAYEFLRDFAGPETIRSRFAKLYESKA